MRIPAGELTVASLVMRLQIAQEFDAASSLAEVPLLAATHSDQSSQTVYLRDVAEISDSVRMSKAIGADQRPTRRCASPAPARLSASLMAAARMGLLR